MSGHSTWAISGASSIGQTVRTFENLNIQTMITETVKINNIVVYLF